MQVRQLLFNTCSNSIRWWFVWYMQVRQLVLDPAIQQEFGRLRRELEEQRSTITQLKEQNDSLNFTAVRLLDCCANLAVVTQL
jgi:hypothetical protein